MANPNNPFGLMPTMRTLEGGEIRVRTYKKLNSYGTALFQFDAVGINASNAVDKALTPGTSLYGGVTLNGGAASTDTVHPIVVSPTAVFAAQMSGSYAEVDGNLNANLSLGAGSSTTGLSGHQVDSATQAVTASLDVQILGEVKDPINEFGNYCRVLVTFNKHRFGKQTAGV